jgi:hypothetical protein
MQLCTKSTAHGSGVSKYSPGRMKGALRTNSAEERPESSLGEACRPSSTHEMCVGQSPPAILRIRSL